MDYIKRAIYGLDPQEQKRKCSSLIRQNQRELDKMINSITGTEQKTKNMIRAAAKRNDMKSARFLAKEIYNSKKAKERLHKSKAQLNSVNLQVNEAFAIRKLEGSMKTSTGLMKEVNSLIRMPELMGTMTQLSQELMRSGIIDEMVTDTLEGLEDVEGINEEEVEVEVDAILTEITGGKLGQVGKVPENLPAEPEIAVEPQRDEQADADEEMLDQMRERLKALQS